MTASPMDFSIRRLAAMADDGDKISNPAERSRWYYQVITAVKNLFDSLKSVEIKIEILNLTEAIVKKVKLDLKKNSYELTDGDFLEDVCRYLDKANVDMATAITLFNSQEETDAYKRIAGRTQAIQEFQNDLEKAILMWPSDLREEESKPVPNTPTIESSKANPTPAQKPASAAASPQAEHPTVTTEPPQKKSKATPTPRPATKKVKVDAGDQELSQPSSTPAVNDDAQIIMELLERARSIGDTRKRVNSLISLLPQLPVKIREAVVYETLADARKISDPTARVSLILDLFNYLPENEKIAVAQEELKVAGQISDPQMQISLSASLLHYLPENAKEAVKTPSIDQMTLAELDKMSLAELDGMRLGGHPPYSPPVAGYISDRVEREQLDRLNIQREVANIANVLTFKQVQPPLALGLFGDWGSGKTFFMGKLQKYIDDLASHYQQEEAKNKSESLWCSRVAQIEFNAWHFSDSNLWASLVTRIYEGLDRELNEEKEIKDKIKKRIIETQIKETSEKKLQAESQLELAKTRVEEAKDSLKSKRKERGEKEDSLKGLINNIPDLLMEDDQSRRSLETAAKALGVPEAAKTYEALEGLNTQLSSFSGRLRAVLANLIYSPFTLLWMALLVILLPIGLTWLIEHLGDWLTEVGKRVAEISLFLGSIIVWLQAQVRQGLGMVQKVEDAIAKARQKREEKIETDSQVIEAKKALSEAQTQEQSARTNLEIAQTELQRLQDELQELRPERKLQRLIEARANSGAYAQHLGIISLIRSDFESMSRILIDMAAGQRDDFAKAPPVQRIILYIDDLDRCKPDRVVEVLEAIHLLLFFPLFVVVVAVDPRWLRHSLAQHYPDTLAEKAAPTQRHQQIEMVAFSTPQDYLEKIFQIPFALRPIQKDGYQKLVSDLLGPLPKQVQKQLPGTPTPKTIEPSTLPPDQAPADTAPQRLPATDSTTTQIETLVNVEQEIDANLPEPDTKNEFTPISSRQLDFTERERKDIQQLWRMFRTPRTVKRFVNIYRLLRAGLASDEELKSFEGSQQEPGEYRVAILLLALITAFPNAAGELLYRLDAWLDTQEANKKEHNTDWAEILDVLSKKPALPQLTNVKQQDQQNKANASEQETKDAREASKAESINNEQDFQDTWALMLDCLHQIVRENEWKQPFKISTFRVWVVRVGRFSFTIQLT